MSCEICDRIQEIKAGKHPLFLDELSETFAVLGDNQGCPGWCVLLLKDHIEHLALLSIERQQRVFADVARVAGAIRAEFATSGAGGTPPRINYECLGNVAAHVHWHVVPRHADDPTPRAPVWGWSADALRGTMSMEERKELAARLRTRLRD
jgi:diadenosine tetraphosphate (Ap4A) HIT family hydrolase